MEEKDKIVKTSRIDFAVSMAADKVPRKIEWSATDSPMDSAQEAKAIALAIWDGDRKETFRIDLWTDKMTVEEMNHFVLQTMKTLTDSYLRATNDREAAKHLYESVQQFGLMTKALKPPEENKN